jgi:hypothetical protein
MNEDDDFSFKVFAWFIVGIFCLSVYLNWKEGQDCKRGCGMKEYKLMNGCYCMTEASWKEME